ncbi:MAG: radical SAM protein [Geminicoccaceae bacterium]
MESTLMPAHAALPADAAMTTGTILTVIVPASHGCNLKCPFCYIDQRKEHRLSHEFDVGQFVHIVREAHHAEAIAALCIQGHEPLLPGSFAYTAALLELGREHHFPVSFVTNGTYLADRVAELVELTPARIAVSLDSHLAERHDRQRGVVGAYEMTVDGLRKAGANPLLRDVTGVASVLIPKKRDQLLGMPALLADIGIERWTVTCLFKVGKDDTVGGPVGDRAKTFQDLLILQREAEKYGIEMTVDDEFGRLSEEDMNREVVDINRLRIHRLQRPSGVFRLMPDGRCSIGTELLQEVAEDTPRWIPAEEHAADFLQRVRDRYSAKQAAQAAA